MADFSDIFLMQSRPFGEHWAQNYLLKTFKVFKDPHDYDKDFKNEYDILYPINGNIIKIEVKAARMVKPKKNDYESLLDRAATTDEIGKINDFGFFQIKNYCADVFILMCVFKNEIKYFVFSKKGIIDYGFYSNKQHRGNIGEGQINIRNINFDAFFKLEVPKNNLIHEVIEAYKSNL